MENAACNSERDFNEQVNSQIVNKKKMYDINYDASNGNDEPLSDHDDYYLEELDDEQSGE